MWPTASQAPRQPEGAAPGAGSTPVAHAVRDNGGVAEFVVIAGLSGAGRSTAANVFEDLGWYVIDNLPPALVHQVADLARRAGSGGPGGGRVVLVAGRSAVGEELLAAIEQLRTDGDRVSVVFLDAPDDVLVRRFEDRRRRHPLSWSRSGSAEDTEETEERRAVADSIAAERSLLEPVKAAADLVIDTSELNVHQLRDRVLGVFAGTRRAGALTVSVVSFGFKHGLPLDADLLFDVRFLPNPHWVPDLRPQSGLDPPVRDYVLGQPLAVDFVGQIDALLGLLLPAYVVEGKAYLTIAIGCTGGRHRSVAIAEELARRIEAWGHVPKVIHRDLER